MAVPFLRLQMRKDEYLRLGDRPMQRQTSGDGSSVDPPTYYSNTPSVHGRTFPVPIISTQPQSSAFADPTDQHAGAQTLNYKHDPYYIWNILLSNDWNEQHVEFDWSNFDQSWIAILQTDERIPLDRHLQETLGINFNLYRDITSICDTVKKHGDLQDLNIPEHNILNETWNAATNSVGYDISRLKRTLAAFMKMQLQLQDIKTSLLEQYGHMLNRESYSDTPMDASSSLPVKRNSDSETMQLATQLERVTMEKTQLEEQLIRLQRYFHGSETMQLAAQLERVTMEKTQLEEQLIRLQRNLEQLQNTVQLDSKQHQSESDKDSLNEDIDRLNKQLLEAQRTVKRISEEKDKFENDSIKLSEKNVEISQKLDKAEDTIGSQARTIKEKENYIYHRDRLLTEYNERLKSVTIEKNSLSQNQQHIASKMQHVESKCAAILKSKDSEMSFLKDEMRKKEKEFADLRKSKEELLTRLSKVAGAKLTDGNPAITDLSDENRPTKLSEKFAELYDNEWTDALEELGDRLTSEKDVIALNLKILLTAYEFCSDVSQLHADNILNSLTNLPMLANETRCKSAAGQSISIPSEVNVELENMRRMLAPQLIPAVVERFIVILESIIREHLDIPSLKTGVVKQTEGSKTSFEIGETDDMNGAAAKLEKDSTDKEKDDKENERSKLRSNSKEIDSQEEETLSTNMDNDKNGHHDSSSKTTPEDVNVSVLENLPCAKSYAEKCASICWHMRIRDPKIHMVFDVQRGTVFDTELYRHYTRTGKAVDYVVWPVLYLHENGPMLMKGVAQSIK